MLESGLILLLIGRGPWLVGACRFAGSNTGRARSVAVTVAFRLAEKGSVELKTETIERTCVDTPRKHDWLVSRPAH